MTLTIFVYSKIRYITYWGISILESVSKSPQSCPSEFKYLDNSGDASPSCYLFSNRSTSWFDANTFCESKQAELFSVESIQEKKYVLEYLLASHYRYASSGNPGNVDFNYEYWTSGTDVALEGNWVWFGSKRNVGNFGWLKERKFDTVRENCLSWSMTLVTNSSVNLRLKEGWDSNSCQKNLRYICEFRL